MLKQQKNIPTIIAIAAVVAMGSMATTSYCQDVKSIKTVEIQQPVSTISYNQNEADESGQILELEKPVIYLYPEQPDTQVDVTLDINGEFLALDPDFNISNGWSVTADPDGTIKYQNKMYPYLFWEADLTFNTDMFAGFCVRGTETKSFLTETLPQLGLNQQETADFIEYWLPKMKNNAYNLISFQNGNYNKAAELNITPRPDTMIRVCMVYTPVDHYININPQQLEEVSKRTGFTVVEWGGAQLENVYQIKSDIIE